MRWYQIFLLAAFLHATYGEQIDPPVPCGSTEFCRNTTQLPPTTFCKDGYCVCPGLHGEVKNCSSVGTLLNSNKTTTPLVSRACKLNRDCNLENGFCNSTISQCDCDKGFVPSTNKHHCLKIVESIGSECTDDKQCLAFQSNTTCKDKKCACGTGYHDVENACWRMAGFGKPCTKTQECSHMKNAICNDTKVCGCADGEVINRNETECLTVAKKFRDTCKEDIQCSTKFVNSVCLEEQCHCRARYHFEEELQKCIINKALDETCENTYECYQRENESDATRSKALHCLANVCECADNYNRAGEKCENTDNGSRLLEGSIGTILITTFAILLS